MIKMTISKVECLVCAIKLGKKHFWTKTLGAIRSLLWMRLDTLINVYVDLLVFTRIAGT